MDAPTPPPQPRRRPTPEPAELDPLRLLSVDQARQILGISKEAVTKLMDDRLLAEYRLPGRQDVEGRTRYTSRVAIAAYLQRQVDRTYAPLDLPEERPRPRRVK